MSRTIEWYRWAAGANAPRGVRPSASRAVRNWLRDRLPEPDVRGKTMVLYARQEFPRLSDWAGMFSEFHSVLGALAYAGARGASAVRVDYRSPIYVDPARGPNWWTYFFQRDTMPVDGSGHAAADEVSLNDRIGKYGRHGGFGDLVNGRTPYLYPMTYGIGRADLHRLLTTHVGVRPEIHAAVDRLMAALFAPDAFVVGVHYRGTDSTAGIAGPLLLDKRAFRVPYEAYADEVRRVLDAAAPRAVRIFVATDEIEFLEFMGRTFGDCVVCSDNAPRVRASGRPLHLDRTLPVSNYEKGKAGLVDCLLLAATSYLVKGRSNLSDASLAFNPRLPYSFCVH